MAENLTLSALRERLGSNEPLNGEAFDVLRNVGRFASDAGTLPDARDVLIRLLERRSELQPYEAVLSSLLRSVGLFPYMAEVATASEQLALEAHRPLQVQDIVFHRIQADVYRRLLEGHNVVLSAPTSFGKSALIDALIATRRFENVVVIVPTIALIDETRRRLTRYRELYSLVTHPSQRISDRNIFVMTQERLLDLEELPEISIFVVDEFYKLDLGQDPERAILLNQAFHRLQETGAQFFLLGPSVEALAPAITRTTDLDFVKTDFRTVSADVRRVTGTRSTEREVLVNEMASLDGPTMIYCRSPRRTRTVADWLSTDLPGGSVDPSVDAAADWIAANFHPNWTVGRALRHGIGIHHGRLPRALAQWMVRAFNDGRLATLVCTSSLIEGVNTRAKNMIIFDQKIGNADYDFFTFNNIRGRSGRMFQHFVGKIVLFHDPPQATLPMVDIPIISQSDNAPDSLLVQLEVESVRSKSHRDRMRQYSDQDFLSMDTLRTNAGIDPARQVALARRLASDRRLCGQLAWEGYPAYGQLQEVADLIVHDLRGQVGMSAGVSSGRQLAFQIERIRRNGGDIARIVRERMREQKAPDADGAIEETLEFLRFWAGHHFPRLLMALQRIQHEVARRVGVPTASYAFYAGVVENWFHPSPLLALEEYGIPLQISLRFQRQLLTTTDLDSVLDRLAGLDVGAIRLSPFERELLVDAIEHL